MLFIKKHRLTYYKSYIQPHLDYANIVWGSTSKTNLMQIEKLQRRACRIILDYNVENIYQSMNELKIMSATERGVTLKCAKDSFSCKGVLFAKRTTLKCAKDFLYTKIPHLVKKDTCFSGKEFVMLDR